MRDIGVQPESLGCPKLSSEDGTRKETNNCLNRISKFVIASFSAAEWAWSGRVQEGGETHAVVLAWPSEKTSMLHTFVKCFMMRATDKLCAEGTDYSVKAHRNSFF